MMALEFHDDWGDGSDEITPLDELIALEDVAIKLYNLILPNGIDRSDFIRSFTDEQLEQRKHD